MKPYCKVSVFCIIQFRILKKVILLLTALISNMKTAWSKLYLCLSIMLCIIVRSESSTWLSFYNFKLNKIPCLPHRKVSLLFVGLLTFRSSQGAHLSKQICPFYQNNKTKVNNRTRRAYYMWSYSCLLPLRCPRMRLSQKYDNPFKT